METYTWKGRTMDKYTWKGRIIDKYTWKGRTMDKYTWKWRTMDKYTWKGRTMDKYTWKGRTMDKYTWKGRTNLRLRVGYRVEGSIETRLKFLQVFSGVVWLRILKKIKNKKCCGSNITTIYITFILFRCAL